MAIQAYMAAAEGGRIVALVGEAGIGKTRLGDTIVEHVARNGARVIEARAYAGEEGIAYGLVLSLIRSGMREADSVDRLRALPRHVIVELNRLIPELVPLESSPGLHRETPAAHLALLDAISLALDALVRGPSPGVLWLDNLERADASSLEALAYLIRRLAGRRLMVQAAWRLEDVDDRLAPFVDVVEAQPSATIIALERLDRDAVASLVEMMPATDGIRRDAAFGDALFEESEGLPLYVAEILTRDEAHEGTRPAGIRGLIRERIGSLGEAAGQLLSTAAVIGRLFDLATVRQASGRSEDEAVAALDELVRRGFIRELGATGAELRYGFNHAAFRDVAYEFTSLARRRLLHRRVADAVRATQARSPAERLERLAVLAAQERAAGREAIAADGYLAAARLARQLSAPRDALAHLEVALALGHPEVVGIQLAIGELLVLLGDYRPGIQALEKAAAIATADELATVELELGRAHGRRGDFAAAASHLDAALALAGAAESSEQVGAWILIERGLVAYRAGELDAAEAFAADALARLTVGDVSATAAAYRVVGLSAMARGDRVGARQALRRSLDLARDDSQPATVIAAANALALAEAAAGSHDAAIELLESALAECRRTGSRHIEGALENNLADVFHAAGKADESMAHLKRAVALFADVGGGPDVLEPEIWKLAVW
jgi:tetratricopeptide (TPR) repeat protein